MREFYQFSVGDIVISKRQQHQNPQNLFMITEIRGMMSPYEKIDFENDSEKYYHYVDTTRFVLQEIHPLQHGQENAKKVITGSANFLIFKKIGSASTLKFLRGLNERHNRENIDFNIWDFVANVEEQHSRRQKRIKENGWVDSQEKLLILNDVIDNNITLSDKDTKLLQTMPMGDEVDYLETKDVDTLLDNINYLKFFAELFNDDSYLDKAKEVELLLKSVIEEKEGDN